MMGVFSGNSVDSEILGRKDFLFYAGINKGKPKRIFLFELAKSKIKFISIF